MRKLTEEEAKKGNFQEWTDPRERAATQEDADDEGKVWVLTNDGQVQKAKWSSSLAATSAFWCSIPKVSPPPVPKVIAKDEVIIEYWNRLQSAKPISEITPKDLAMGAYADGRRHLANEIIKMINTSQMTPPDHFMQFLKNEGGR